MARPALVTPLLWWGLGVSLACGLAGQLLLAAQPAAFAGHWFRQPWVLAALHLTTLGWVGVLILGVLTQFLPMLLGRSLGPTALAGGAVGLFVLGLLLLVGVFAGWRAAGPALAAGLALTGGAALTLALAWPALAHRGPHQRLCRATLASSLFYLVLTAGLGTVMAQGLVGPPWLAADPLALIRLHAHLGLLGFGGLMVFAVSYELLPMFNLAKGYPQWPGWLALGLVHLGLGALVTQTLGGPAIGALGEALLALAAFSYSLQMLWIQARAFRKVHDASAWVFWQACGALALVAVAAPMLSAQDPLPPAWAAAAVYGLLFGFLGGAIASQLQKIVPLMAWVDRFSALAGKATVPVAGQLLHRPLAWLAVPLHGLALLSGCVGLALRSPFWLRVSGGLGALFFVDLALLVLASRLLGESRPLAPQGQPGQ